MRAVDRQPGFEGGVEDGRRDLADAAAEAVLELAVDDHGCLLEALRRRSLAGRAVEGECAARLDQRAVDQLRDELDVVQAPGVPPYVVVYEETTPVMPIVVCDLGRPRRLGDADGEVVRSGGRLENAAAAIALAVAGRSS